MRPSLSVIMPALNEVKNIEGALRGILGILPQVPIDDFEILVMTCLDKQGKHDGTVDVVRRLAQEEPRIRSIHVDAYQRLGEKFQNAVQLATKKYVVMVPGDNENDPASFIAIFGRMGDADMILSYTVNPEVRPWFRRVISWVYSKSLNVLFWQHLRYFNGINVYQTQQLREVFPLSDSFAYSAEIVIKLRRRGYSFVEVPVKVQPTRGSSHALKWDNLKRVVKSIISLWTRTITGKE